MIKIFSKGVDILVAFKVIYQKLPPVLIYIVYYFYH